LRESVPQWVMRTVVEVSEKVCKAKGWQCCLCALHTNAGPTHPAVCLTATHLPPLCSPQTLMCVDRAQNPLSLRNS